MNKNTQLKKIERKIESTKQLLMNIEEMWSGSLSKQYNVCGKAGCRCKDKNDPKKHGPYYQLSYSNKGRSTSQFIKKEFLVDTRKQIENYKKFKKLTELWVDLALEHAKLKIEIAKENLKNEWKLLWELSTLKLFSIIQK